MPRTARSASGGNGSLGSHSPIAASSCARESTCISCETVGEGPPRRTRFVVVVGGTSDRDEQEVALIRSRCRYASFPVNLYGQPMSAGPRRALLGLRTDRIRLDDGRVIGIAGIRPKGEPGQLMLLTRGVWSETVELEGTQPGFLAIVDVDLRKDLSQRGVLRGEGYDAVLRAVMRAHAAF